jgi:hypothetical protein
MPVILTTQDEMRYADGPADADRVAMSAAGMTHCSWLPETRSGMGGKTAGLGAAPMAECSRIKAAVSDTRFASSLPNNTHQEASH